MILRRLAATVAATALLAGTAWAQSSALPYADTSPNSTPTIPFGGIHTPTNSGKVATAASLNNAQDVLSYITDGESPNEADYQGRTAFMYAAMSNNTLITRILLDHGGRTELKDRLGNTALHYAAQRGSVDVMRLLLSANAPIDAQNREGVTPLMLAANSGRFRRRRLAAAEPRRSCKAGLHRARRRGLGRQQGGGGAAIEESGLALAQGSGRASQARPSVRYKASAPSACRWNSRAQRHVRSRAA